MDSDAFEALVILFVIVICVVFVSYSTCYDWGFNTGTGEQTGYISEVMNDGWLWQPTKITLLSIVPTYSSEDTSWYYSPQNDDITKIAIKAMRDHSKVTVSYITKGSVPRWEYSNRVIITNITIDA